mgnify:CR=1 FL=1
MLRYRVNTYSESYKRVANCTAHAWCKSTPAYQTKEAIMKYRKKPVAIEAVQWTGENKKEIILTPGFQVQEEKTGEIKMKKVDVM